ncbi:uncharacterized protein LOC129590342 isoform X2 [Paramacrobiotus metropolitanus]|uniref:uncharacterized protein LOC129590342 isoform X2 n=1 Tax=Paramacrobiotus metropolitanus TaxID=2943436 RepID=UPI00244572D1|nr:uncharacterized protein LOC129590342 isoform X2 [Paramacrobiotus metropolitanus]
MKRTIAGLNITMSYCAVFLLQVLCVKGEVLSNYDDVTTEDLDGALFEGDIIGAYDTGNTTDMYNNVVESARLWPNGIVPFYLDSNTKGILNVSLIRLAMAAISQATHHCIRFINRTQERSSLRIILGAFRCAAEIGYRENTFTRMALSSHCDLPSIIHELLHVLGFFHEHTRLDRDEHVIIHYDNIQDNKHYANDYNKNSNMDTLGMPYDRLSIMHYPPYNDYYAKNKQKPVMSARTGELKRNTVLSDLDVHKLKFTYKCEREELCNISVGHCHVYREGLRTSEAFSWLRRYAAVVNCQEDPPHRISIYCSTDAIALDAQTIVQTLRYKTHVPNYSAYISDKAVANATHFHPIKQKLIQLGIHKCTTPFTTSKLRDIELTQLVDFGLYYCSNQQITRMDFDFNANLKRLVFHATTISSVQENAFTALVGLEIFQPEEYWKPTKQTKGRRAEILAHLQLLHCDCRYHWFRSWLAGKPTLFTQRSLTSVLPTDRWMITVGEMYIPINCRNVGLSYSKLESRQTLRYFNYNTSKHPHWKPEPFAKHAPADC